MPHTRIRNPRYETERFVTALKHHNNSVLTIPGGGYPAPTFDFWRDTIERSDSSAEVLIRGFMCTSDEYTTLAGRVFKDIREGRVVCWDQSYEYLVNLNYGDMATYTRLDSYMRGLRHEFRFLQNDHVPLYWAFWALYSFIGCCVHVFLAERRAKQNAAEHLNAWLRSTYGVAMPGIKASIEDAGGSVTTPAMDSCLKKPQSGVSKPGPTSSLKKIESDVEKPGLGSSLRETASDVAKPGMSPSSKETASGVAKPGTKSSMEETGNGITKLEMSSSLRDNVGGTADSGTISFSIADDKDSVKLGMTSSLNDHDKAVVKLGMTASTKDTNKDAARHGVNSSMNSTSKDAAEPGLTSPLTEGQKGAIQPQMTTSGADTINGIAGPQASNLTEGDQNDGPWPPRSVWEKWEPKKRLYTDDYDGYMAHIDYLRSCSRGGIPRHETLAWQKRQCLNK